MSLFFSRKDASERVVLSFDFTALLDSAETIVSCIFSADITTGAYDMRAVLLLGSADLNAAPIIRQTVQGGVNGSFYKIRASATTSLGRILVGEAFLPVSAG